MFLTIFCCLVFWCGLNVLAGFLLVFLLRLRLFFAARRVRLSQRRREEKAARARQLLRERAHLAYDDKRRLRALLQGEPYLMALCCLSARRARQRPRGL